jgi:hypothetical protein
MHKRRLLIVVSALSLASLRVGARSLFGSLIAAC